MTIQSPAYSVAGTLLFVFKTCATTSEKTAVQTRTRGRSRHIWDVSFFSCAEHKTISTLTFPVFCLSVPPLPFHSEQNKTTRRLHFINSRPKQKQKREMTLCETSHDFILFLYDDKIFKMDFLFFFFIFGAFFFSIYTRFRHCAARKVLHRLGTEGRRWSASQHRSSVFVIHVTFLSGVAAHQAEIMRPRCTTSVRILWMWFTVHREFLLNFGGFLSLKVLRI